MISGNPTPSKKSKGGQLLEGAPCVRQLQNGMFAACMSVGKSNKRVGDEFESEQKAQEHLDELLDDDLRLNNIMNQPKAKGKAKTGIKLSGTHMRRGQENAVTGTAGRNPRLLSQATSLLPAMRSRVGLMLKIRSPVRTPSPVAAPGCSEASSQGPAAAGTSSPRLHGLLLHGLVPSAPRSSSRSPSPAPASAHKVEMAEADSAAGNQDAGSPAAAAGCSPDKDNVESPQASMRMSTSSASRSAIPSPVPSPPPAPAPPAAAAVEAPPAPAAVVAAPAPVVAHRNSAIQPRWLAGLKSKSWSLKSMAELRAEVDAPAAEEEEAARREMLRSLGIKFKAEENSGNKGGSSFNILSNASSSQQQTPIAEQRGDIECALANAGAADGETDNPDSEDHDGNDYPDLEEAARIPSEDPEADPDASGSEPGSEEERGQYGPFADDWRSAAGSLSGSSSSSEGEDSDEDN